VTVGLVCPIASCTVFDVRATVDQDGGEVVAKVAQAVAGRQTGGLHRRTPDVRPVGTVDRSPVTTGEHQVRGPDDRGAGIGLVLDVLRAHREHREVPTERVDDGRG
jgi:hypothetical protein